MDVRDRRRGNAIVARQRQDVFAREMRGESRKTASSVDPQDAGREVLDDNRRRDRLSPCRISARREIRAAGTIRARRNRPAPARTNIGRRQRMLFVTARRAQRSCRDSAQPSRPALMWHRHLAMPRLFVGLRERRARVCVARLDKPPILAFSARKYEWRRRRRTDRAGEGPMTEAISRADVTTKEGRKYLVQLCKHFQHKRPATWGDDRGRIEFGSGLCELTADDSWPAHRCDRDGRRMRRNSRT